MLELKKLFRFMEAALEYLPCDIGVLDSSVYYSELPSQVRWQKSHGPDVIVPKSHPSSLPVPRRRERGGSLRVT